MSLMKPPSETLLKLISEWHSEAIASFPGALNRDRTGVMIHGEIGGAAYIRLDGSIELEPWDEDPENPWRSDPNVVYAALVAALKKWPELAELMPDRQPDSEDCLDCGAIGHFNRGLSLLCPSCYGLGWRPQPNPSLKEDKDRSSRH